MGWAEARRTGGLFRPIYCDGIPSFLNWVNWLMSTTRVALGYILSISVQHLPVDNSNKPLLLATFWQDCFNPETQFNHVSERWSFKGCDHINPFSCTECYVGKRFVRHEKTDRRNFLSGTRSEVDTEMFFLFSEQSHRRNFNIFK